MQVDIDKIVETVRVTTRYDWTWTDTDLDGFCAAQGWQIAERLGSAAVIITDLMLKRPEARVVGRDGQIREVIVFVTDEPPIPSAEALRRVYDQFSDITAAVSVVWGPPTSATAGADGEVRWDLPTVVIRICLADSSVYLRIVNPEYQAWLDTPDDEDI